MELKRIVWSFKIHRTEVINNQRIVHCMPCFGDVHKKEDNTNVDEGKIYIFLSSVPLFVFQFLTLKEILFFFTADKDS